jgi:D-glycero-D-manno-heptose 1,7-bisphosphate phosphatase
MTRLVLLDRDGVLNEDCADHVRNPGQLVMIPRAAAACARLNRAGLKTAIVSNQSGVGQGLLSASMLELIHEKLRAALAAEGAHVDLILTCHEPPWSDHERRKPRPGMLLEAMRHFRVPPEETVMIGDQLRDLQAARAAGVRRLLVRTGKGSELQAKGLSDDILPVAVYDDLYSATDALLRET